MELLDKIRKVLRFLAECLSPWIAKGRMEEYGMIPYSMTKRLIIMAVIAEENDDNKALVYVKGHENAND